MDEPKPLNSLFKEKLFRIPDYQRGYAWERKQLKAFWEDIINLPDDRFHYTGVLTLNEIPSSEIQRDDKEFWLVNDHSYKLYHIVDGQQRLTTFTLFLQALIELLRSLPEYEGQSGDAIYLANTLSIADVERRFLFKMKPPEETFRTYKFGYAVDNPSDKYMRYRILCEEGRGTVSETFYTLNLSNGKRYFKEQLRALHNEEGIPGLAACRTWTPGLFLQVMIHALLSWKTHLPMNIRHTYSISAHPDTHRRPGHPDTGGPCPRSGQLQVV